MAEEGVTFYYVSKQHFDFEKNYNYLKKEGLSLRDPDTHLITFQRADGEYVGEEFDRIQGFFYRDKNSGVNLYLNSGHRTFWSFSETSNYFSENLTFNYMSCLEVEERLCQIFTSLAIEKISQLGSQFLGFTLDMYGETETYEFEKIFDDTNTDILNDSYISDLTILSKNKMDRLILDEKAKVFEVNRDFNCIAKNEKLAEYLKSLLSTN